MTTPEIEVCQPYYFGRAFYAIGDREVQIRAVRFKGVPNAARHLGTWAVLVSERQGNIPMSTADLHSVWPREQLRPVDQAVALPLEERDLEWYVVAGFQAMWPGMHVIEGWEVEWREGRHSGTTLYEGEIHLNVAEVDLGGTGREAC